MTLNEFKAWLRGFEASFEQNIVGSRTPNAGQWATIKAELAKVTVPADEPRVMYAAKWLRGAGAREKLGLGGDWPTPGSADDVPRT